MDRKNNVFLIQSQWDSMDDAVKDKDAIYNIAEIANDGLIKKVLSHYEYNNELGDWEERAA